MQLLRADARPAPALGSMARTAETPAQCAAFLRRRSQASPLSPAAMATAQTAPHNATASGPSASRKPSGQRATVPVTKVRALAQVARMLRPGQPELLRAP